VAAPVGFEISDFGFELMESFDFEIVRFPDSLAASFGIPPPFSF
jgi:hypothetical protein